MNYHQFNPSSPVIVGWGAVSVLGDKINLENAGEGTIHYYVSGIEASQERIEQFDRLAVRYETVLDV